MSDILTTLLEMGYEESMANEAVTQTNSAGILEAVEWIEANRASSAMMSAAKAAADSTEKVCSENIASDSQTAASKKKCLKCDECGKILKDSAAASAHAIKTSHSEFVETNEEIKPVSEEERKALTKNLVEKMQQRKLEIAAAEARRDIEKEKKRRVEGRQMSRIRQEMRELQLKKAAEERLREKELDRIQRERVKLQIQADREEMRKKSSSNKQINNKSEENTTTPVVPVISSNECRVQVRFSDGQIIQNVFNSNEPLSAVRLWVTLNNPSGDQTPFTFVQTYPPKTFLDDEMQMSLKALNLTPSCTLHTKPVL